MTFEEILDQALAVLHRRGRVTYRMLKGRYNLDENPLEDLKTEIIKGQRLAVGEDERDDDKGVLRCLHTHRCKPIRGRSRYEEAEAQQEPGIELVGELPGHRGEHAAQQDPRQHEGGRLERNIFEEILEKQHHEQAGAEQAKVQEHPHEGCRGVDRGSTGGDRSAARARRPLQINKAAETSRHYGFIE